ncbi:MAG TPA: UDP-glucose 4-epimerase GalE [Vicinamibacterales bacterium]|nr:UDP-glucose 4-epimerase GalE [Vicinamibacterales bacterium]
MRVAVTGGAGYIGSVVVEALMERGDKVLVIDNLSKGHRDTVPGDANFSNVDLAETSAVTRVLTDFGAEAVVHMAAFSLVGESVTDPAKYYDNNVTAGLSLLTAMHQAAVTKLVFSSTAAVYGEPAKQPIEETDPTRPTNPYGETKLAFEHALQWYERAYGLSSISLRYFNAAGASERNGERHDPETHLIPLVLNVAAGASSNVTIFGDDYPTRDGTCVRDYIHVVDLAAAHVAALTGLENETGCRSYNLGNGGEGYSVKEIIEAASTITGRDIKTTVSPRRAGDPAVLIASSARIQRDLGWSPRHQLHDIVQSAWSWMTAREHGAPVEAEAGHGHSRG